MHYYLQFNWAPSHTVPIGRCFFRRFKKTIGAIKKAIVMTEAVRWFNGTPYGSHRSAFEGVIFDLWRLQPHGQWLQIRGTCIAITACRRSIFSVDIEIGKMP